MNDSQTSEGQEMHVDPSRANQLSANLATVLSKVKAVTPAATSPVRLVAVSKLKPANDILALHKSSHAQLHFGENYQQELLQKSQLLPHEIRWHFIGGLQTNKCKPLAEQVPNLWCVESVDAVKKADQLNKGRAALSEREKQYENVPLRVFVQINTSGEAEKSGVGPKESAGLCKHVMEKCPHLRLQGVMTIGALARSKEAAEGKENEDFITLCEIRDRIADELQLTKDQLELSMGMSDDFESAIRCGSNEVRVGSTIFGERPPKQDAQVQAS